MPFAEPFAVVAGDFNGDHRSDLAVYMAASCYGLRPQGEPWYDGLFTLLNAGGGNLGRPIRAGVEFVDWCGLLLLAVADVNGDGKDDLVTAGGVFLSRGDGTFQRVQPTPYRNVAAARAGDFNADGKSDLLVSDEAGTRVLLSNGDGTFRSGLTLTSFRMIWTAIADLNRDGAIDVICSGSYGGSPGRMVFLGNGDGTFGEGLRVAGDPYPITQPGDFFVADFNGDGLPDLATQAGIQLGAGDGRFQSRVPYP
jgi:hypothetical protein